MTLGHWPWPMGYRNGWSRKVACLLRKSVFCIKLQWLRAFVQWVCPDLVRTMSTPEGWVTVLGWYCPHRINACLLYIGHILTTLRTPPFIVVTRYFVRHGVHSCFELSFNSVQTYTEFQPISAGGPNLVIFGAKTCTACGKWAIWGAPYEVYLAPQGNLLVSTLSHNTSGHIEKYWVQCSVFQFRHR